MTKKLEETFNLPPIEDVLDDETDDFDEDDVLHSLEEIKEKIDEADKINRALAPVTDLSSLDSDMDEYAKTSIEAFENLIDFAKNVEDRHAAELFNAATRMMANALTAKTAKADRKLKVIQMQLQKEKLDLEARKLDHKIATEKNPRGAPAEGDDTVDGKGVVLDRNELINQIIAQSKEQK